MVNTMSVSRSSDASTSEPSQSNENLAASAALPPTIPVQTEFGLRLSALNPKYLHTNSTSHTWPFSAVAELVDNAYDPDVKASQLHIDLKAIERDGQEQLCMTFQDNGNGMASEKLYKMLSFGFCEKVAVKNHKPVGHYGNGFKSGSMRIGKDALVLTKRDGLRSIGFLSQSYLTAVAADTIIVPMATWSDATGEIMNEAEKNSSLPAILQYSVLESVEKINEEFACIQSESGTRIIISKLRRSKDDKLEFDILSDKFDIRIPEDTADSGENAYKREERQHHIPASDFSLRAYLSILYLKPKMQIYLRTKKVKTVVVRKSLSKTEVDVYKPQYEKPMKIVFGFSENVNHYGIMMYHSNRLIKPYVRVGCQLKANNQGVGVVGVIECNSLQPTHNKQDFDYTPLFRATMNAVGNKLNEYWNEKTKYGSTPITPAAQKIALPDELWVQCDDLNCLKWRKLPSWVKKNDLPDKWYCRLHPDSAWADCSIAEEEEDGQTQVTPYEKKLKKRTQQLKELERLKLARKKAAELQLESLKRQQAEVRNQLQQEEIQRLRNQLIGGPSNTVSSSTSVPNMPATIPPNYTPNIQTPRMNMASNYNPPQPPLRVRVPRPGLPPGARPIATIPPQHPAVRPVSVPPSPGGSNVLMNGGDLPVVAQVFSMNAINSIKKPVKVEVAPNKQTNKSEGTKKRPISLDSDDEDDQHPSGPTPSKNIKTETQDKPPCIELLDSPPNSPSATPQRQVDPKQEPPDPTLEDTKANLFMSGMERLLNGGSFQEPESSGPPPPPDEKPRTGPDFETLTVLLGKRTQSLRRLRRKIHALSKILFPDVELPDINATSLEDTSIEDFLDTVIAAHKSRVDNVIDVS